MKPLRIGTRASKLAMAQTNEVVERLHASSPSLGVQVVPVRTQADASPNASLAGLGRGMFVKELEDALLRNDIDLAVHSLKDLPTTLPVGLTIAAICQRAEPNDVLVNRWNSPLADLPSGARIGTSSPRRTAQLKAQRPDIEVLPIRGNVETRLAKAVGDDYDGVILAAAGIDRLGIEVEIAEQLPIRQFVPAPGQGALAVQIRDNDHAISELVAPLDHPATRLEVTAERALLQLLGGGCQLPMGSYGHLMDGMLHLIGYLSWGEQDFSQVYSFGGPDPHALAASCLQAWIDDGAPVTTPNNG